MAKRIILEDKLGNQLHPMTLGKYVVTESGETVDGLVSKTQMFSPVVTMESSMSKVGVGNDIDVHSNIKDGAYEECMFEGRTLVNLAPSSFSINWVGDGQWKSSFLYNQSSTVTSSYKTTYDIKPNTDYTIIVNIEKNTAPHSFTLNNEKGSSKACVFPHIDIQANVTGVHKIKVRSFETFQDSMHMVLRSQSSGIPSGEVVINNIMIIEGDFTNIDVPYFTGICDSKMPILRNVGKNLFDGVLKRGRYTISEGIYFADDTTVCTVNKIKVKPSKSYTLSIKDGTLYNISEYSNGVYIKSTLGGAIVPFTTSSTTNEIHISFKGSDLLLKAQLEESPTETTYESYKTNILQTSEEIVLRSVGNVKDTYNALTGEYVRRIGEEMYNGDETWYIFSEQEGETTILLNCMTDSLGASDYASCIGNSFNAMNVWIGDKEGVYIQNKHLFVRVLKTKATSIESWNEWLKSNPVTIQYELATPITTIIKPPTIPFAYANGHVVLESGYSGQSLLPTLKYSAVTGRTGQVTQNAKILRQQEKQIASLEDLLLTQIVQMDYERTLLQFDFELNTYGLS